MVLSLAFILAFIGAAVSLVIGILIFSEVSDAIICPGTGSSGTAVLFDTLGETSDITLELDGGNRLWGGQLIGTSGQQITSVTLNNIINDNGIAFTAVSEIYTGATTDIDSATLVATSDNTLTNGFDGDFTWTFTPAVTVNDPDTFIAITGSNWDSNLILPSSSVDVGLGVITAHDDNVTSGFFIPFGYADLLMKVEIVGAGSVTGLEECENAKDTAWTVIGILPVALFFALFAVFGALGRQN